VQASKHRSEEEERAGYAKDIIEYCDSERDEKPTQKTLAFSSA
jgi:hypothetical protein